MALRVVLLCVWFAHVQALAAAEITISFMSQRTSSTPLEGTLVLLSANDQTQFREWPVGSGPLVIRENPGSTWRAELRADSWWMDAVELTFRDTAQAVALPIWPTATLVGSVTKSDSLSLPSELKVAVETRPFGRVQPILPRGTEFRCPVDREGGTWSCRLPAATFDLVVLASGYVPRYRWDVALAPGTTLDLGAVDLREGGSLVAWLQPQTERDAPKQPARAVLKRQVAEDPSPAAQRLRVPLADAVFDPRGFVQLAPLPAGKYMLEVSAPGFAIARVFPIEIFEGRESGIRRPIVLSPAIRLSLALDPPRDPSDQPWRVSVHRANDFGSGFEPVPAFDGTAPVSGKLSIPNQSPGRFLVRLSDAAANRMADEEFTVRSEGDAALDMRMSLLRVRGKVRQGVSPVAATLWFGGLQGATRVEMQSTAEGEFRGWLPRDGKWVVDLKAAGVTASTTVDVEEGCELVIEIPRTRISGSVSGAGGPAAGAEVLVADGSGAAVTTISDADGRFTFEGLRKGTYALRARSRMNGETSPPVTIDLPADDAERDDIRLVLAVAGDVAGRVTSGGRPVIGAQVFVFPDAGGEAGTAVTDPSGRFLAKLAQETKRAVFTVLPPSLTLRTFERPLGPEIVLEIEASGGTLELQLPSTPGQMALFQDGVPLPLPMVFAWTRAHGFPVNQGTAVRVPDVAPGLYRLCTPSGHCVDGEVLPGSTLHLDGRRE